MAAGRDGKLHVHAQSSGDTRIQASSSSSSSSGWKTRLQSLAAPLALMAAGGVLMLVALKAFASNDEPSDRSSGVGGSSKRQTKRVRFKLPKEHRRRKGGRKKGSGSRSRNGKSGGSGNPSQIAGQQCESPLQRAWDQEDIQETYGSMARVAQLFREFERVAVAPSSLSSTSSSTDDDVSGGNRNRKLRVWTPATFDKLIAAATATETATNDAGGIIPTESTGGGWRKGVLLLFNAIAQEDREDVDGHCGEGNGVGCEHISFVAFLRAFGCAMRGTREDHAKFLLRLLDPESSGFVTQDSLEQYIALQKAVLSKKGTSSRVNADENENLVGEVDAHTETATDTRPGAGNAGTRTEALTLFTKMSDFARVRHERGGGVAAGLVGYVSRDDFVHCCSGIDVDPATAASVRDSGKREACCRLNFLLALT